MFQLYYAKISVKPDLKLISNKILYKKIVISLSNRIDFVGFRNFFHFRILRARNVKIEITLFKEKQLSL